MPSWEHIKIHKLRGVRVSSRTKRVRAKRGKGGKKGSGVSREKEKNLDKCERKAGRERRAWREKREKRGRRMEWKHFGCDESQHCHWSREGREGSRGRWKDKKKKKGETPLPHPPTPPSLLQQKEYLCWEAGCVGTTSQILRINDQLAQSSAQCCCSANILDRRNKD